MITAEQLQTLSTFTTEALGRALYSQRDKASLFNSSKFLGMTNGGQFCYRVDYSEEDEQGRTWAKVFLTYDPEGGSVIAILD
jgi:hypothetical protein